MALPFSAPFAVPSRPEAQQHSGSPLGKVFEEGPLGKGDFKAGGLHEVLLDEKVRLLLDSVELLPTVFLGLRQCDRFCGTFPGVIFHLPISSWNPWGLDICCNPACLPRTHSRASYLGSKLRGPFAAFPLLFLDSVPLAAEVPSFLPQSYPACMASEGMVIWCTTWVSHQAPEGSVS